LSSISSAWSFIGQSLFSTSAWLNASLDEFRVYDGRLSPAQIAADSQMGPNIATIPVSFGISGVQSNINLTWPSYGIGYTVESTPALGANTLWSPISRTPVLSNNLWQLALPATNNASFIRLMR
jgi:hypothetical protein